MFSRLMDHVTRPPLFSVYTAEALWTDPHVAGKMLEYHLEPDGDTASRNHSFIHRSVAWLDDRFGLASGKRVLDLGCGPGLYANGLAQRGAKVTGVDFSGNSLLHARGEADRMGLEVSYLQGNYLEMPFPGSYDLILLIYGDLCALGSRQREALLAAIRNSLAPGGRLVFDVFSLALFNEVVEGAGYEFEPRGGFWSAAPYFLFSTRFKYEEEKAYLDRYAVVEEGSFREVFNWIQCYDPDRLEGELHGCGWRAEEVLGSVAGDPFDAESQDFAVIAHPSR